MGYFIWALIKKYLKDIYYGVLFIWALIKNYYWVFICVLTSLYNLSILNNILHLNII